MKLKELKKIINSLSAEELEQDLVAISDDLTQSCVADFKKAKTNLIYSGDDDPCELQSTSQLREAGYTNDCIAGMELIVRKGQYFIDVNMCLDN